MKMILLATAFIALVQPASAQERIALVVGNGSYSAVAPLDNPVGDAVLIASTLEKLDFKVTLLKDTDLIALKRAISMFGRELRAGGPETVGLFYYAGHGVQSFGTNYLLPVDASLTDAADLDLVALEASAVLRQMASARNRINIVILDACRNNPFEEIASLNDNGLAEMKAPTGTYLAYATAPGAVALDGLGGNSPFTQALVVEMTNENLPIEQVFKNVRVKVIDQTGGAQTPWDTSSLTNNFVFRASAPLTGEELAERQLWQSVEASRDPVQLMLFLRSYPEGRFHEDARNMLGEVMQQELGNTKETKTETEVPPDNKAQADQNNEPAQDLAVAPAETDGPPQDSVATAAPAGSVFFDQPLVNGQPEIVGKTIEELVKGSPLFSPIEGIPDSMWKDQKCSNCHQWTREALCIQAQTYLKLSAQRSLTKQHPFGGSFKQNLRVWAAGGCE